MSKPIALITGATSGIGKASARILSDTYRLVICGRRADRLRALEDELAGKTETYPLSYDVRDRRAVEAAIKGLPKSWQEINVLINNAGNAHGLSTIDKGDLDDWDAMIDINVKGLLYVSKSIIPGMIERGAGHIINIGSIAGIEVYPKGNVYNASKHAVKAITEGMRLDLYQHGIKVSEIKPGLVNTEFSQVRFKGDKDKAESVYEGFDALTAEDIARTVKFILMSPPHVNIADMLVLPTAQASATLVKRG